MVVIILLYNHIIKLRNTHAQRSKSQPQVVMSRQQIENNDQHSQNESQPNNIKIELKSSIIKKGKTISQMQTTIMRSSHSE